MGQAVVTERPICPHIVGCWGGREAEQIDGPGAPRTARSSQPRFRVAEWHEGAASPISCSIWPGRQLQAGLRAGGRPLWTRGTSARPYIAKKGPRRAACFGGWGCDRPGVRGRGRPGDAPAAVPADRQTRPWSSPVYSGQSTGASPGGSWARTCPPVSAAGRAPLASRPRNPSGVRLDSVPDHDRSDSSRHSGDLVPARAGACISGQPKRLLRTIPCSTPCGNGAHPLRIPRRPGRTAGRPAVPRVMEAEARLHASAGVSSLVLEFNRATRLAWDCSSAMSGMEGAANQTREGKLSESAAKQWLAYGFEQGKARAWAEDTLGRIEAEMRRERRGWEPRSPRWAKIRRESGARVSSRDLLRLVAGIPVLPTEPQPTSTTSGADGADASTDPRGPQTSREAW